MQILLNTISRISKKATRPLTLLLCAAAIDLVFVSSNSLSRIYLVAFLPVFIFFAYAIFLFLSLSRRMRSLKFLNEGYMQTLRRLQYLRSRGFPLFRSLEKIAKSETDSAAVKAAFDYVSKGSKLGVPFSKCVENSQIAIGLKTTGTKIDNDDANVAAMLKEQSYVDSRRVSKIEISVQKFATLKMFVSTILPSFFVFLFVGSSVISGSGFGLEFLSISLLIFVPLAFSAVSFLHDRCIYA